MRKLLIPLLLSACGTDIEPLEKPSDEGVKVELVYTGSLAVDGCEFFVDLHNVRYKPVNEEIISKDYQNGTNRVEMVFEVLPDSIAYQCGLNPQPTVYPALKIIAIN